MFDQRKKFFAERSPLRGSRPGFVTVAELLAARGDDPNLVITNNRGRVLAEFWGL